MKGTMIVAALFAATACRTPGRCPVGETRCEGEVAQICDPGGQWRRLLDCAQVTAQSAAPFVCAPVVLEDGAVGRLPGHTCVPAAVTTAPGGGPP